MIVDVHAHYHPRPYIEALERAGVVRAGRGGMAGHPDTDDEEHIQKRLEMMEQAGVGMQVLSPAAGRAPYAKDETAASRGGQTRQRHLRHTRRAVIRTSSKPSCRCPCPISTPRYASCDGVWMRWA